MLFLPNKPLGKTYAKNHCKSVCYKQKIKLSKEINCHFLQKSKEINCLFLQKSKEIMTTTTYKKLPLQSSFARGVFVLRMLFYRNITSSVLFFTFTA